MPNEETNTEQERGALIHTLSSAADTYAVKEAAKIVRRITDRVKDLSQIESDEIKKVTSTFEQDKKRAKKAADKAITVLKEDLAKVRAELEERKIEALNEVNLRYREMYDAAERELNEERSRVDFMVRNFKTVIDGLSIDKLKELAASGSTVVDDSITVETLDPKG